MDWNDAYSNAAYIEGADDFPPLWREKADAFRTGMLAKGRAALDIAYGTGERQQYDAFFPAGQPQGLALIIHGGYWLRFDKDVFSHLAAGAVARGWVVVMPRYPLCPQVSIGEITKSVEQALTHAAQKIDGPIQLAGHSAGGHLVTRMVCEDIALPDSVAHRIGRVLTISGVHDLRPLIRTEMNADFMLDAGAASAESPGLLMPRPGTDLIAWVGADERPEFLRQTRLIALNWQSFDVETRLVEEPEKHHFDVIDSLEQPDSDMMRAWLD